MVDMEKIANLRLFNRIRFLSNVAVVKPSKPKKSAIRRVGAVQHQQPFENPESSLPNQYASQQQKNTQHQPLTATRKPLSCAAFCTARQYNLESLMKYFDSNTASSPYRISATSIADDYIHAISSSPSSSSSSSAGSPQSDVFFFREGALVAWNATASEIQKLLQIVRKVEIEEFDEHIRDVEFMQGVLDPTSETGMKGEDIILGGRDENDLLLAKLAFSHGLSRSTQLGVLEKHLDKYLDTIEDIPLHMMKGHEPPITSKDVTIKQGQLLYIRGLLNLHSELVDSAPEFYWSRADLARHFDSINRALDVLPRIRVLNQRLDHADRLVDLMTERVSRKHGTRLELIIIALIAVEVLFECVHYLQELRYVDLYKLMGNHKAEKNVTES